LATPTAVEFIPIVALAVCTPPEITPVALARFPTVVALFITPIAAEEREVAEEKFDRPTATEFDEPAVVKLL
jgi:hypothetical protein